MDEPHQGSLEELPPQGGRGRSRLRIIVVGVTLAAVLALVLGVVAGWLPPGNDGGASDPMLRELSGRTFVSVRVTEDGADRELVEGTRIEFMFLHDEDREEPEEGAYTVGESGNGAVSWHAGCNHHYQRVEASPERLALIEGERLQTAALCEGELDEQEDWVSGFLASSPRWDLKGDRLALRSGTIVIELAVD